VHGTRSNPSSVLTRLRINRRDLILGSGRKGLSYDDSADTPSPILVRLAVGRGRNPPTVRANLNEAADEYKATSVP